MNAVAPYLRRLADDKRYPVSDQAILGRHSECDIALVDEPGLSRKHARFHVSENKVAISDIGSLNGTLVNGKVVRERCELSSGDRLVFDEEEFIILIPDAVSVSSEAPTRLAAPGAFELDDTPSIRDLTAEEVARKSAAHPASEHGQPASNSVVMPNTNAAENAAEPLHDPNEKFSTTGVWQNNHVHPDAPIIAPQAKTPVARYRWFLLAGALIVLALLIFFSYNAGKQQTAQSAHSARTLVVSS